MSDYVTPDAAPEGAPGQVQTGAEGATPQPQGAPAPEPTADSFSNINPDLLPPELQGTYKSMQGDYTRKMQAISEYQRLGELDELKAAVDFVQNLRTNPDYALQVHNELGGLLTQAGLIEAAEQAVRDIQEAQGQPQNPYDQPYGQPNDPTVNPEDAIQRELQEMRQIREQIESERREAQYEAELTRQHNVILNQNPHYKEGDIKSIYNLAFATKGDLFAADALYKEMQKSWASGWVREKANVDPNLAQPPVTGSGDTPPHFTRLDDPKLKDAVSAYLRSRSG